MTCVTILDYHEQFSLLSFFPLIAPRIMVLDSLAKGLHRNTCWRITVMGLTLSTMALYAGMSTFFSL